MLLIQSKAATAWHMLAPANHHLQQLEQRVYHVSDYRSVCIMLLQCSCTADLPTLNPKLKCLSAQ